MVGLRVGLGLAECALVELACIIGSEAEYLGVGLGSGLGLGLGLGLGVGLGLGLGLGLGSGLVLESGEYR